MGKREALSVFGSDYNTKDGTGVRDYIHVVDLAKGHTAALKKVESSPGCVTYNLGTGVGYSVLEMVKAYEKACGKTLPYKLVDRRPGDVGVVFGDASLAKAELGKRLPASALAQSLPPRLSMLLPKRRYRRLDALLRWQGGMRSWGLPTCARTRGAGSRRTRTASTRSMARLGAVTSAQGPRPASSDSVDCEMWCIARWLFAQRISREICHFL